MLLQVLHLTGLQTGQMMTVQTLWNCIVLQRIIEQATGDALDHHYLLAAAVALALYIDLVIVDFLTLLSRDHNNQNISDLLLNRKRIRN